jgi:hypothetical protein
MRTRFWKFVVALACCLQRQDGADGEACLDVHAGFTGLSVVADDNCVGLAGELLEHRLLDGTELQIRGAHVPLERPAQGRWPACNARRDHCHVADNIAGQLVNGETLGIAICIHCTCCQR